MMNVELILYVVLFSGVLLAFIPDVRAIVLGKRTDLDVLASLSEEEENIDPLEVENIAIDEDVKIVSITDAYSRAGLYTESERRRYKFELLKSYLVVDIGLVVGLLSFHVPFKLSLFIFLIGNGLHQIYIKRSFKNRIKKHKEDIGYLLPTAMEDLVMAVQGGSDLHDALKVIIDRDKGRSTSNPVVRLFAIVRSLEERGHTYEVALKTVSEQTDISAIKHCFIHLAKAHKEGGDVVEALRELSDATQREYQETVEEEIGKLPVKATMPVALTFSGLLLCILTLPGYQIIDVMKGIVPANVEQGDFNE